MMQGAIIAGHGHLLTLMLLMTNDHLCGLSDIMVGHEQQADTKQALK
jgi:hypothetical protein